MTDEFLTYESFLEELKIYEKDQCDKCGGIREIEETEINIIIQDRELSFSSLAVLRCKSCGKMVLPNYSKCLIYSAYKNMASNNQYYGFLNQKNIEKNLHIALTKTINMIIRIIIIFPACRWISSIQKRVF